ncbi:MAG: S9 family peptidase [Litorilinea sp.]
MNKPHWQPDALIHYPLIEHVHVAPQGDAVLYTTESPHLTDDASEFRQRVYCVNTQGDATPRPLTHGPSASTPKWSPDGTLIAFVRRLPDSPHTGIWLMPAAGGEPWPLVAENSQPDSPVPQHESIGQFEWRFDGKAIAFTSVPTDDERRRRTRQRDDVRQWQVDFDFAHLFVLEFAEEDSTPDRDRAVQCRQLTQGRVHVESFSWHPAGHTMAYIAQDTPFIESWRGSRLVMLSLNRENNGESQPVTVATIGVWKATLAYAPDGAWIACQQGIADNRWPYAGRMHIFPGTLPAANATSATAATAPRPLADVSDAQPGLIGWTPDSRHVLVLNDRGLGTEVLALPIDGSDPLTLVGGVEPCKFAHISASGHLALVRQNHHTINGVDLLHLPAPLVADTAISAPQRRATPAPPAYPTGPLPQVQELQWTTPDGFTIDGILYLPAEYDAARDGKLPLLLHVHGGPMGVFQRVYAGVPYYYTPAALCEQGIAVLRCNPRGSSGYGKEFRFANLLDWGGGDYRDLMQGVDTVLEMGIADANRLGVCGWSYGGYMSSWIITQTHRFAAASIGAPLTNAMSFPATADISSFVPDYYGGEAWEVFDFYRERSPIFHAHKVQTPAIMQHGGADPRVPLEQGLQYYYVLARNQVPVDLFIYPRQGHAIREPRLLADAIQRNITWFTGQLTAQHDAPAGDVQ